MLEGLIHDSLRTLTMLTPTRSLTTPSALHVWHYTQRVLVPTLFLCRSLLIQRVGSGDDGVCVSERECVCACVCVSERVCMCMCV